MAIVSGCTVGPIFSLESGFPGVAFVLADVGGVRVGYLRAVFAADSDAAFEALEAEDPMFAGRKRYFEVCFRELDGRRKVCDILNRDVDDTLASEVAASVARLRRSSWKYFERWLRIRSKITELR